MDGREVGVGIWKLPLYKRSTHSMVANRPHNQSTCLQPPSAIGGLDHSADLARLWLSGKAARTVSTYRYWVKRFGAWAGTDWSAKLLGGGQANAQRIMVEWIAELRAQYSTATVALAVSAISSLLRVARMVGVISWVVEGLPVPRVERVKDTSGPTMEEVRTLLRSLRMAQDRLALRDYTMASTLFVAGLRRSEAVAIDCDDLFLDSELGWVAMVRRKGSTTKQKVLIGQVAGELLSKLRGNRETGPIFLGHKGGRWHPGAVRNSLAKRARDAGIERPVRPHGLRHRGASEAARQGWEPLMQYGGWRSSTAALRYLDDGEARRREVVAHLESAIGGTSPEASPTDADERS